MPDRAIWAIGCGQLVNWGVLYFAFSVLLVPLEELFDAPRWLVAGAFSAGLLVSAAVAPTVGRLADRGQGPAVVQGGGWLAAALLIAWGLAPSLVSTYLVWSALGLCMAASLYEPVFAILGKAFDEPQTRLRAIATVTVIGGLASTAFLPGTSALLTRFGLRGAVFALAFVMAATTLIVGQLAFRGAESSAATIREVLTGGASTLKPAPAIPGLGRLAAIFAISIVVNAAVLSNLVAALIDRGLTPTFAATVAGTFGIMQLPGRVFFTNPTFVPHPAKLLLFSFGLQMIGLAALMSHGTVGMWMGVLVFASGSGLTTLARPYLVLHEYGAEHAGYANGVIGRWQQLARAAGPVSAAAMAGATGYTAVFGTSVGILALASILMMRGGFPDR